MRTIRNFKRSLVLLVAFMSLVLTGCIPPVAAEQHEPHDKQPYSPGLTFVDYRHLAGGEDGVLLMDLDPESPQFGKLVQQDEIGEAVLPHHLYFNATQDRLYNSALGGSMLYELKLKQSGQSPPRIDEIVPIDVQGNLVGEDIYFTKDGSRFYMTFMGGKGGPTGGAVGVFDAKTNELIETIEASIPADPASGQPFIMYPHGISANEELGLLMVTSTTHPDGVSGAGNTVTLIDMKTNKLLKTYLVAEDWETLSAPVEVLLLRDDLPPFALATTLMTGDIWVAGYNAETGLFNEFEKKIEGEDTNLAWPLEFYIHENRAGEHELYVTFGGPGVINVYSLESLPELPLKRTLPAAAGAHHMLFFETKSGREAVVVQNNLLNIDGLNAGTLMVLDSETGELLGEVDLPTEHNLLPESIESAYGHGHDYHH